MRAYVSLKLLNELGEIGTLGRAVYFYLFFCNE